MTTRTITLTDQPPVKIEEAHWPVIAKSGDCDFDNQYEFQANRVSNWSLFVRRHEDGRAIVYAVYDYSTQYRGERSYAARRGELLAVGEDLPAAIFRVCDDIAQAEAAGGDSERWNTLAHECIADLPAVELV